MNANTLAALFCAVLLAGPAGAEFNNDFSGTSGAEFLKLGGDARGAALGQAMTALTEDAAAIFYNPAGLSQLQRRQGTATQGFLYQDVMLSFAAYAHPVTPVIKPKRRFLRPSGLGTLAVGILYLNTGPIKEIDNKAFETGGEFTPRDVALMAGWGGTLTDTLDLGVGLKFIDSRIKASSKTGALDAGARLRLELLGWPYVAAVTVRNLGGRLRFHEQDDPLPMDIRLGQTLRLLPQWIMSLDLAMPRDASPYPAFGTEMSTPVDKDLTVAARLGYDGRVNPSELDGIAGISVGLGAVIKGWGIDYAWVPYGDLGHTHRFSIAHKF